MFSSASAEVKLLCGLQNRLHHEQRFQPGVSAESSPCDRGASDTPQLRAQPENQTLRLYRGARATDGIQEFSRGRTGFTRVYSNTRLGHPDRVSGTPVHCPVAADPPVTELFPYSTTASPPPCNIPTSETLPLSSLCVCPVT